MARSKIQLDVSGFNTVRIIMNEENPSDLTLNSSSQVPCISKYVAASHGRRHPRPSMTVPEAVYLVLGELLLRNANIMEVERLLSESEDSESEGLEGPSGKKILAAAVRFVFKSDAPTDKRLVGNMPAPLTADPLAGIDARLMSDRIEQALADRGSEDLSMQIVKERLTNHPGRKHLTTFAEIGAKLELPTSTVYDLYLRGIKRLAKELGE